MHDNARQTRLLAMAFLIVAACAVYWQCLGHEFLVNWDDPDYVTENPAIRGVSWANLQAAFSTFYVGNYAPLQIVSYMLDYSFWGLRPGGFLLTNILLHTANGLLCYQLLRSLLGRQLPAFIGAFIFLTHPVQVESVAWVSQRKNVLAMFFFLLALLGYLSCREPAGRPGRARYLGSQAAFLLALLTKSVAVVLPAVLLLYELCFVPDRPWRERLGRLAPYGVAALAAAWIAYLSQAEEAGGGRVPYYGGSPWATFLTMLPVLVRYLRLLVWPTGLSAVYDVPLKTGVDGQVLLAGLVLLLAAVGTAWLYRCQRKLAFWLLFFAVGLLPVSQVIPINTLMNDRYLYFPMLGAAGLVGAMAVLGLDRLQSCRSRLLMGAVLVVLMLTLPLLAYQRTTVWTDSLALWSDTAAKTPGDNVVFASLVASYCQAGQFDKALAAANRERELNPFATSYDLFQGLVSFQHGQYPQAAAAFSQAIEKGAETPQLIYNLGLALEAMGRFEEAAVQFNRALLLPHDRYRRPLRQGLDRLLERLEPQLSPLRQRVATNPDDVTARGELALRLDRLGFTEEAVALYRQLEPRLTTSWQLYFNLAKGYQSLGQYPAAIQAYERSLTLNPANGNAWNNLGLVLGEQRAYPRAAAAFQRAMGQPGGHHLAAINLALLYLKMGDKAGAERQFLATVQQYPAMRERVAPYLASLSPK